MKVTLLCSDVNHPVYPYLKAWQEENKNIYNVLVISNTNKIPKSGDILFLISCSKIINSNIRKRFTHTLVLHASDLPLGRGWSPHIWDIVAGKNEITLSLLNAEDSVDSGNIWKKKYIKLNGSELYNEINTLLFKGEIELISWACRNFSTVRPVVQIENKSSYYRKRIYTDSQININKSIKEQFNLLRVCDPNRYPAFFELNGHKYKLIVERHDEK